jgi:hypothetical protein
MLGTLATMAAGLVGLCSFALANATAANPFNVSASIHKSDKTADSGSLQLDIEDSLPVSNACDYFIQRFEYVAPLKALVLTLGQDEQCNLDRYAKRQAHFSWKLPTSLRNKSTLCVLVNHQKIGALHLTLNDTESTALLDGKCED